MNKTLILVMTISLLGLASGDYNESCDCDIVVTANGEDRVLTVESGEMVHLHGEVGNLENITRYQWSFNRNIVNIYFIWFTNKNNDKEKVSLINIIFNYCFFL